MPAQACFFRTSYGAFYGRPAERSPGCALSAVVGSGHLPTGPRRGWATRSKPSDTQRVPGATQEAKNCLPPANSGRRFHAGDDAASCGGDAVPIRSPAVQSNEVRGCIDRNGVHRPDIEHWAHWRSSHKIMKSWAVN